MKIKHTVMMILGGAGLSALSFCFSGIEGDAASVQWICLLVGIALMLVGAFALVSLLRCFSKAKLLPIGASYAKKRSILSAQEYELLRILQAIVDQGRYIILPQMTLVSVIDKLSGGGYRNELFRTADFCIVNKRSYEPLLLIELNDASHKRADRQLRDEKVAAICDAAGIPLLTIESERLADHKYIKSALRKFQ